MEIKITHQGRLLADLEITPDAQLQVRGLQPGAPAAAQYVWGGQAAQGAPQAAAQYVWGSQAAQGGPPSAAQYVWGATNTRPGGLYERSICVDCPNNEPTKDALPGTRVSEGLLTESSR